MAVGDPIPPNHVIWRAIRSKQINSDGTIIETAFLLRPPTEQFPEPETYLSFGIDAQAATAELNNIRYVGEINVADILAVGLTVVEGDEPQLIRVAGMPRLENDEGLAMRIAKRPPKQDQPSEALEILQLPCHGTFRVTLVSSE